MANSIRGPIEVATNGALSGTGSTSSPLSVSVDGATIEVNGSNQLQVIGGGGGSPGGANTNVQFNDSAAFGGQAGFTFTKATNTLTLAGPVLGAAFSNSNASPGSPVDGQFYVVASGTSPSRVIQFIYRDGGSAHVLASVTY